VSILFLTLAAVKGLHRPDSITKASYVQGRSWGWIKKQKRLTAFIRSFHQGVKIMV
jgi:hypothetical protein